MEFRLQRMCFRAEIFFSLLCKLLLFCFIWIFVYLLCVESMQKNLIELFTILKVIQKKTKRDSKQINVLSVFNVKSLSFIYFHAFVRTITHEACTNRIIRRFKK